MIDVNELRKGVTFESDGNLYRVLEYTHNKPGRGTATIRIKARDIRKGTTLEMTFISGDRVHDIRLDYHNVEYLYRDENFFYFMDMETFEQPAVPTDLVADYAGYLKENMEVNILMYESETIGVDLPNTVILRVEETEPGIKGDTASGGSKPAKMETGLMVNVPFFVNADDMLIVNTTDGSYVSRA